MRCFFTLAFSIVLFLGAMGSPIHAAAEEPSPPAEPIRQSVTRLDGSKLTPVEIEKIVGDKMREAQVTGLGLAILNDNKIVYLNGFGLRNVEKNAPMTVDTILYGASFTKAIFAYLVMQLVDEKRLDLDKPIYTYLPKPLTDYPSYADLAGDDRYKRITARMLLSHTAGFPNFRFLTPQGTLDENGKLRIYFEPGTRFAYSGEGINLLGFVVEQITGELVATLMQKRIFDRFAMRRTSMVWQPAFADRTATGYDEKNVPLGHKQQKRANPAGSMDTTISDYARFMRGVMSGEGISKNAKAQMLSPQIRIASRKEFPTLSPETTTDNDAIRLSYGLGWGLFWTPYGKAFFKEGHLDGWENHVVCFTDRKIALILMTNSSNGDSMFKDLLNALIGDHFTPWYWEDYLPASQAASQKP